VAGWCG